jgi:hypothetical protein
MTKATGTFEVSGGTEDTYDELEGGIKLTHASGTQAFSGDISGEGAVHWLMLHRADRTAHLVGTDQPAGFGARPSSRTTWTCIGST